MLKHYIQQQIQLLWYSRNQQLIALSFFGFILFLWPVVTTANSTQIQHFGPGMVWLAAMFAQCLNLTNFFQDDHQSGLLEVYALSPNGMTFLILWRILIYSFVHLVPQLLVSLLAAALYRLSHVQIGFLLMSLTLGLPILTWLGALLNALLLTTRQGGLLLLMLIFPLYIPIVILATSMIHAAKMGMPIVSSVCLLLAINALCVALLPALTAYGLRASLET